MNDRDAIQDRPGRRQAAARQRAHRTRQCAGFPGFVTLLGLTLTGPVLAGDSPKPMEHKESKMPPATSTHQTFYGTMQDGSAVTMVTLANAEGIEVDVISYGGIITRLVVPDRDGEPGDIVLARDSIEDYQESNPYFGALIGRYGNRIAGGRFEIDGETVTLDTNDGDNHLHGGVEGFDKKNWTLDPFVTETSAGVVLTLVSPDGDQGYPGTLDVKVVYELSGNELDMRFHATTDKPTVVNLTQHSYFNLDGEGTILDHLLEIPAATYTPVGPGLIPTGELAPVAGTPFDFREAKPIGEDIDADDPQLELGLGYDHNFILKDDSDDELVLAARLTGPDSGRVLEVLTVEPAVQFYSGNFLDGTLTGQGGTHDYRTGLCLEPQHSPNSPNEPDFPSTTLRPGEEYETRIVYRFSTVD